MIAVHEVSSASSIIGSSIASAGISTAESPSMSIMYGATK